MNRQLVLQLSSALLAVLTGWVAMWSWQGLVGEWHRFLWPTFFAGGLLAVTGAVGRWRRLRWFSTVPLQLVAVLVFLNHREASAESWAGWVPTTASMARLGDLLRVGADALGNQYSPVPGSFPGVHLTLTVAAVGLLLAIDLLAFGLGRVPLAGMPVLVIWMIPISLLSGGVSWFVFATTGLLFVMLLATEETRRVLGWSREIAGRGKRFDSFDQFVSGNSVRSTAARLGFVSCAAALVVPIFVPLMDTSIFDGAGSGPGGDGPTRTISILNPMVDLRRDLVQQTRTPYVEASTDDPDPSYLRLTVLDQFDGSSWRPSGRDLPAENRAEGDLPAPPGLTPGAPGKEWDWRLTLLPEFETAWLPTPYPLRSLDPERGDWRYDIRTLDFAEARGKPLIGGMDYRLQTFAPDITALRLDDAFPPPASVLAAMTKIPATLPKAVSDAAEELTTPGMTNYEKAVALQDWFRRDGGFEYSTDRGSGSGMERLTEFLTTDRVGYCEQFAAAMATMGRALKIPSRVAVGFLHPTVIEGDKYLYTSDDLHAWPEMFFSGIGWVRFEPTPAGRTGAAPAYTGGVLPAATPNAPSGSPQAVPSRPSAAPTDDLLDGGAGAGSDGGVRPVAWLGGVLLLLLAALPRLLRGARRRARLATRVQPGPFAEGLWAELEATATDLQIPWPPGRSAREVAKGLVRRVRPTPERLTGLEELVEFVERARYARAFTIDEATAASLRAIVTDWSRAFVDSVPPSRARRAALWPRSVWTRPLGKVTAGEADEEGRSSELAGLPQ